MCSAIFTGGCTGSVSGLKSEAQFWVGLCQHCIFPNKFAFGVQLLKIN